MHPRGSMSMWMVSHNSDCLQVSEFMWLRAVAHCATCMVGEGAGMMRPGLGCVCVLLRGIPLDVKRILLFAKGNLRRDIVFYHSY
uniref:Uncharacterized protein n=1 Tax=Acrobeloides nanus TaxID=290746 RepID=A0A914DUJ8_9BILA